MNDMNANRDKLPVLDDLYEILDSEAFDAMVAKLDRRQVSLVNSAVAYHSLINPGRELEYRFYMATGEEYPRLTDVTTLSGDWVDGAELLGHFRATSIVRGKVRPDLGIDDKEQPVPDNGIRFIRISPTLRNDASARAKEEKSSKQKLYDHLEKTNTLLLDTIRETKIKAKEVALRIPKKRQDESVFLLTPAERQRRGVKLVRPNPPKEGRQRAILFGLHWLQTGGAERWAFENIRLAREAGYLPVVVTDQLSHHLWINRPELDGALLILLTHPMQRWVADEPLLRSLVEKFDFQQIIIHHCAWLYARLPWFGRYCPDIPVTDSLHIIEYATGGYPSWGVVYDRFIDRHHVISPQLTEWMVRTQKIPAEKVFLAPLIGLTTDAQLGFKERKDPQKFTIAFVGRLARQKRPDVFLLAADRLRQHFPDVRIIMHGDGELAPIVDMHMEARDLGAVVERRGEDDPVTQTLADSDLLLLTSTNEGLALTVLEAIAAGIPAISTDVGSQSTLVPADALLPRDARQLLKKVVPLVERLKNSEPERRDLWQREADALQEFSQLPSATEWMKGILS